MSLFFLLFFFIPSHASFYSLDSSAFLAINGTRCKFFNGAAVVISDASILPPLIFTYSYGWGYYDSDQEARRFGGTGLCITAAVVASNQLVKLFVERERPMFAVPGAQGDYSHGLMTRIFPSEKYSFPSQSASLALSGAIILGYAFPHWDKYFFTLAALNGLARIYKGAHYPSDVLCGFALGAGVTYTGLWVARRAGPEYDIRQNTPVLPLFSVAKRF
ncbi:MAG: phosphatase PAP2 family protein [Fibrobacterota bacterium]